MIYQYPLKIDKEIIEKIREIAKNENRSLNKQIEFILKNYLSSCNNLKNAQS